MATPGDETATSPDGAGDASGDRDGSQASVPLVAVSIGVVVTVLAGVGSFGAVAAGRPVVGAVLFAVLVVLLAAFSGGVDGGR